MYKSVIDSFIERHKIRVDIQILFFFYFTFYDIFKMGGGGPEGNLQKLVLSSNHVGPRDQIRAITASGKRPHSLRHLISPQNLILK